MRNIQKCNTCHYKEGNEILYVRHTSASKRREPTGGMRCIGISLGNEMIDDDDGDDANVV
jgi:hypothetical protein